MTFVDGRKKRIHFFASRLQYLRFVTISILENERVETLVQRLARHFVAFGGLPLLTVFDRSRTIVTKSGKGRAVETFNATFAQAILDIDIGVGVEMSEARSGNQKGEERTRLQRDVKRLKRQREILKKRRPFSREQAKLALIDAVFCRSHTRGSWQMGCKSGGSQPPSEHWTENLVKRVDPLGDDVHDLLQKPRALLADL